MDTEHEVKVKVTADVRSFQASMKEAADMADDLKKQQKRFKAHGIKGHKDLSKVTKSIQKGQKEHIKAAIQHEKKLEAAISSTVKTMKEKAKAFKGSTDAIRGEVNQLKKLEDQLVKVRKERHRLGGKTMGERLRGGAGALGRGVGRAGAWAGKIGLGLAGGALGLITGILMGQITQSYQAYTAYGQATGGLIGLGGRGGWRPGRGARMGYDMATTAGQARGVARQTGSIADIGTAQALSRAYGFDVGEAGGYMGAVRRAGFAGFGKGDRGTQELEKIMARGVRYGIEDARLGEVIGGVIGIMERQRGVSVGDISGGGVAAFLAMLGQTGLSGFQGAAGASLAQQLDAGIRGPGGGEAGQALMLQAFGFGRPGGTTSYVDALRMQERGLSDPENFQKVMMELTRQYGRSDERSMALKELFGTSIDQGDALGRIFDAGKMTPEALEKLQSITNQSKTIEEQALQQMKQGFGGTVKFLAGIQNDLVTKGAEIAGSVRQMQKDMNDMIRTGWPIVVEGIKLMASALRAIKDFLFDKWGDPQTVEKYEKRRKLLRESEDFRKKDELGRFMSMADLAINELGGDAFRSKYGTSGGFGTVDQLTNRAVRRLNPMGDIQRQDYLKSLAQGEAERGAMAGYLGSVQSYLGGPGRGIAMELGPEKMRTLNRVIDDMEEDLLAGREVDAELRDPVLRSVLGMLLAERQARAEGQEVQSRTLAELLGNVQNAAVQAYLESTRNVGPATAGSPPPRTPGR